MTGFIATAGLAVVVTLLLLLRPLLWRRSDPATASHRQLNAAIHRDQLVELESDRSEGTLAEDDYQQARMELQRRVLEDGGADAAAIQSAPQVGKKTIWALIVALPLAAGLLYVYLGNPAALSPTVEQQHRFTPQEVDRMVAGLAAKLEKEPDNMEGWVMLARSYKAMGRLDDAERAFQHAEKMVNTDAQLLADYADVLATKAGGNFAGKPSELIEKALKVDPNNMQALWLAGSVAFDLGQFDKAAALWERLLKMVPPGSDDAKQLAAGIAEAHAKGGKPEFAAVAGKSVRGRVALAPAVRAQAAPGDTVMVVAREAGGPRMPIAVLRLRAADLPLDFVLDDSLAMTRDHSISTVKTVEVEARVSKSGMAAPQKGDLFSAPQNVPSGATGVNLLIDQVRP